MTEPRDGGGGPTPGAAIRRPYEKPSVAWEETMDQRPALMAACGKISGQSYQCDQSSDS